MQTLRKPLLGVMMALVLGVVAIAASGCGNSGSPIAMNAPDTAMASSSTDGTTVGGAKMVRTKDIVDNAANADNVTTVVSLVKAAGLVDTLKSPGPFTVFAPDNEAFNALPPATVTSLQDPKNKKALAKILTYHVVPGTYTSADLEVIAKKGGSLKTVEGEKLTPVVSGGSVAIKDAKGGLVKIRTADVVSSNGVTHVIGGVLMP